MGQMNINSMRSKTKQHVVQDRTLVLTRSAIFFFTIIAIVLGKIIRWFFSGDTLINNAIGSNIFLEQIIYDNPVLTFWSFDNSSVAGDNTVLFFKAINIFQLTTYEHFEVLVSIIFNAIIIYFIFASVRRWNLFQAIFFIFSVGILNIFSFTLAKEPIQMLVFLCLCWIICSKASLHKKTTSIMLLLMMTALLFRGYYILMLMFFLVIHAYLFWLKPKSKLSKLSIILVIIFIYMLFLIFLKYYDAGIYNQFYYLRSLGRIDQYNTAIKPILSVLGNSDIFLALDALLVALRLMFPVELIFIRTSSGLFSNILIVLYQVFISSIVLTNTVKWKILSNEKKLVLECFYAFLIMSAIFEPDFGSWMRHESVTLPILLILSNIFLCRNFGQIRSEPIYFSSGHKRSVWPKSYFS